MLPIILFVASLPIAAQGSRPAAPTIYEPARDSVVSGEDVHMVAGDFSDPDGDGHACTDWMIVDRWTGATAWSAPCVGGFLANHIHLGDGTFAPELLQEKRLKPYYPYTLRVRFRDDSGDPATEWSEWSAQPFRTTAMQQLEPMVLVDVVSSPAPEWSDSSGAGVVLPGPGQSSVKLENSAGEPLLEILALDGMQNQLIDAEPASAHLPLRITIANGASGSALTLPASRLTMIDDDHEEIVVHLPELSLEPAEEVILWISENGSSHYGEESQTGPDFSRIAQANPVPWVVRESGYEVELVAGGFQLPVAVEPVPEPGPDPDSPILYVAELYGNVRVITRDGTVSTYAENLLNFDPLGDFPGSGERGLADLAFDPESGDLFVTLPYHPEGSGGGAFAPRVLRLVSSQDGHEAVAQEVVLDLPGEWIGPSHQISNISLGPDQRLYVHIADGNCIECARNLDSARGKIIRLEMSGEPAADNPWYDASDGITARDYVFAAGFRNPFGGAWRSLDGKLYEVENGPSVDRFARVDAGADYGWGGTDEDMRIRAIYNWSFSTAAAPVNLAFIQPETFGGSGFPWWKQDNAYVTESGPTWATGQPGAGKRIGEIVVTAAGDLGADRRTFVEYNGTGKSTVAALAAGPDGLYFSDLYSDANFDSPIAPGARIFRVSYTGSARFNAEVQSSAEDCGSVQFSDASDLPITYWHWRFGDGTTSDTQNPLHQFADCGVQTVDLIVEGMDGERVSSVVVDTSSYTGAGLAAEYFEGESFDGRVLRRVEPEIAFHWSDSPVPDDEGGFSARWRGWIRPRFSQVYQIRLGGDTPARLWIGDSLVIDDWDGNQGSRAGRFEMEAGTRLPIRIEARSAGEGSLDLTWSSKTLLEEPIPTESLYPHPLTRHRSIARRGQ